MQAVTLFAYAFVSNVALAVLPHEPAIIWYGARLGVWPTALVATTGTVVAALVDHRLLPAAIQRAAARRVGIAGLNPRARPQVSFSLLPSRSSAYHSAT